LIAQGWNLNKCASTILRLQTLWRLIHGTSEQRAKEVKVLKVSKREQEREANREQQNVDIALSD
jgi:hypothetical protein